MRLLLTGKGGLLGSGSERSLAPLGEVTALSSEDLADPQSIRDTVMRARPEAIMNAAADADVDRAQPEPELALPIDGVAPGVSAGMAREVGAALMHYMTDHVFDGNKATSYSEVDPPPINSNGRSRLEGEQAFQEAGGAYVILRTRWLYCLRGPAFPGRVLQWSRNQPVVGSRGRSAGKPHPEPDAGRNHGHVAGERTWGHRRLARGPGRGVPCGWGRGHQPLRVGQSSSGAGSE